MMKKQQKGFTLIELMIVVAIIGILASVAIPMYGDYVTRARLGTIMASVNNIKTAVTVARQEGKTTFTNAAIAGAGANTNWPSIGMGAAPTVPEGVKSITVKTDQSIEIVLKENVSGESSDKTITLTPTFAGSARWTAGYDGTDNTGNDSLIDEFVTKYNAIGGS